MNITYSEWGLANRYDDEIELNINLKNHPELHNKILKHELGHDAGSFTIKDFKHDMTDKSINILSLSKFMLKHPKSLSQFLPVYKHKKHGWVYDISLLIIYSVALIVIFTGIYLGIKI